MNAIVTVSAVELALLRLEAARREVDMLFDRLPRNGEITAEEDARISAAEDRREQAEAELKRVAREVLGVDPQRLCDAIS